MVILVIYTMNACGRDQAKTRMFVQQKLVPIDSQENLCSVNGENVDMDAFPNITRIQLMVSANPFELW
jgi:hypothetical protein